MTWKTLFLHPTGPLIRYTGTTLIIEDLNPEQRMEWQMTRTELLMMALRSIWASWRAGK